MKTFGRGSSGLCRNSMRDRSRILWICSRRSGAPRPFRELTLAFSDRSVSIGCAGRITARTIGTARTRCGKTEAALRQPWPGFDLRKTDSILKRRINESKRKSLGTRLERSRIALARWQGLFRRWLLPQRADGSGSRPDEGWLRNHFRQPQSQHAAIGCQFSYGHVLRWERG